MVLVNILDNIFLSSSNRLYNIETCREKMKKCPVCNSTRIRGEIELRCEKCGYTHSDKKRAQIIKYGKEDGA